MMTWILNLITGYDLLSILLTVILLPMAVVMFIQQRRKSIRDVLKVLFAFVPFLCLFMFLLYEDMCDIYETKKSYDYYLSSGDSIGAFIILSERNWLDNNNVGNRITMLIKSREQKSEEMIGAIFENNQGRGFAVILINSNSQKLIDIGTNWLTINGYKIVTKRIPRDVLR